MPHSHNGNGNPFTFFAPGIPAPGGSKRAFTPRGMRFPVIVDDCDRNKPWRGVVALAAREKYRGEPMAGPLSVVVTFLMPRPKGHTGKKGPSSSWVPYPTTRPDATKLWRAAEDALTGILWNDDAQIVHQVIRKEYAIESCGVRISVEVIGDETSGPVRFGNLVGGLGSEKQYDKEEVCS